MNTPTPEEMSMGLPINYDTASRQERRAARLKYIELQDGACHFCGCPLDGPPSDAVVDAHIDLRMFPPGMFDDPVHLHHSHDTSMTIGAVHARCNAYLWQYKGE